MDEPSPKVLVVGDAGVGKTSFVHLLCHGTPLKDPQRTIGVNAEPMLFQYQDSLRTRNYFIHFWDVGGVSRYENSRHVFYTDYHGIILVHDMSNKRSYDNLRAWMREINQSNPSTREGTSTPLSTLATTPVIIVGTKTDLLERDMLPTAARRPSLADNLGAAAVSLSCFSPSDIAAQTTNRLQINDFLRKVIDRAVDSQRALTRRY